MTYLYVEYPYYKKFMIYASILSVTLECVNCDSSYSSITTMHCSTTKTTNSWLKQLSDSCSQLPTSSTTSTESRFSDAIFSMSMYKWEQMSSWRRGSISWEANRWNDGYGTVPIFRRLWWDATDSHSRMNLQTSLIQNCFSKISSEDTQTTLSRSHWQSETLELVNEFRFSSREFKFNLNLITSHKLHLSHFIINPIDYSMTLYIFFFLVSILVSIFKLSKHLTLYIASAFFAHR